MEVDEIYVPEPVPVPIFKKEELLKKYEELKKKLENYKCNICFEADRNILLYPCSHMPMCSGCVSKIPSNCPICRQKIAHVFLAKM